MKSMNDLVNACATIGDWGGYKIYEWYKLFPEERERALREYMYLKDPYDPGLCAPGWPSSVPRGME